MTLKRCSACTTQMTPEAPACPHCGGTEFDPEVNQLPKISKNAGATDAALTEDTPEVPGDPHTNEVRAVDTEETNDPEPLPDYDTWSADDLRAELADRGLSTSGNKQERAARLREDDKTKADQNPFGG